MTRTIGSGQVQESQLPHNDKAWIWLFEVEVGTSEAAYITPYDAAVTFDGNTYQPYPMTVPTVPEAGTTNAVTATLTLFNLDDMITNRLRDNELLGNKLYIRLVHEDHLSETDVIAHEAVILGAEVVREKQAVKVTIGIRNWLALIFGRRFLRLRCHHVYGSDICGYDKDRTGALATCERTFSDCEAHGTDEANAGLFVLHPKRFGGFKGIPSQNRG